MRLGSEGENRRERPGVWDPTGGWHRSSAIIGLVYKRKGCRRDGRERKREMEGVEGEREKKNRSHLWYDG